MLQYFSVRLDDHGKKNKVKTLLQPAVYLSNHTAASFHRDIMLPRAPCSADLMVPHSNEGRDSGGDFYFTHQIALGTLVHFTPHALFLGLVSLSSICVCIEWRFIPNHTPILMHVQLDPVVIYGVLKKVSDFLRRGAPKIPRPCFFLP